MPGDRRDAEAPRYVVAGLSVHPPAPLIGLATEGFFDGELGVVSGGDVGARPGDWFDAPITGPVSAKLRADGGEIALDGVAWDPAACGAAVYAAAPFAAALQAKVTLYAAGVAVDEGVVAVIGASGTGKTTLAQALEGHGGRVVTDDLLPCRLRMGLVAVPAPVDAAGRHGLAELSRVYFLRRDSDRERSEVKRLGGRGCFKQLIRHGFGEIAVAKAWSAQVDVYHRIADNVPSFELTIPDDLNRLDEVARWFLDTANS